MTEIDTGRTRSGGNFSVSRFQVGPMSRCTTRYMGRGPKQIEAHLVGDILLVRLHGVLTLAEQQLVKTLPAEKGLDLLKQVRTHLLETAPLCWKRR